MAFNKSRHSSRSSLSSEEEILAPPDLRELGEASPAGGQVGSTEEAATASALPWISTEHPITLYEGAKLVLMFPVVVIKVRWSG